MPLFFLLIGVLFVVTGINNTTKDMFGLVKSEMPGFLPWLAAIVLLGFLGYINGLKPVANAFLLLVVVVLLLVAEKQDGSGGFFTKFTSAIQEAQTAPATTSGISGGTASGGGTNVGGLVKSGLGLFSGLGNLFKSGGSGMDATTFDI